MQAEPVNHEDAALHTIATRTWYGPISHKAELMKNTLRVIVVNKKQRSSHVYTPVTE
jgi:hypothetical protein